MTLPNAMIAALLLATATLFGIQGSIRHRAPPEPLAPTAAAIAWQREQAAIAVRAEAQRREAAAAAAVQRPAETEEVLPAGEARADVFGTCTACHSTAIIRRSQFRRDQWDELMTWMTDRHGMNPLEGTQRELIVDYLARHFGPAPPARGRNPFLN